jgi:hypothetical protein
VSGGGGVSARLCNLILKAREGERLRKLTRLRVRTRSSG